MTRSTPAIAATIGLACGLFIAPLMQPAAVTRAAGLPITAHYNFSARALSNAAEVRERVATARSAHAARHAGAADSGLAAEQSMLLDLINAERIKAGVGPLRFSNVLNTIAQARSQDMIDRHYFSHQIPGVGYVFDILDHEHVGYEMAGENIAMNNYIKFFNVRQTVTRTNTDLMNSPEHRANILEPRYSEIGLGLAFEPGSGKLIVTEVFVQP